jgi:two-component system sensor histidine kinase PilS (NtrC family)
MTQEEAYNRPLHEVIPDFVAFSASDEPVSRGEIKYRTYSGETRILGFNCRPLVDKYGERAGHIINFQDLTHIKKMEEELNRADRLAAIGALSASIAHEIRNPLASISGSVQLIANSGSVDEKDRKLLNIVLRETDRLNDLIKDFLTYARPVKPVKTKVLVKNFFADIRTQLATDSRFSGIIFDYVTPDELHMSVDTDQLKQVFWNLLINSVDAMKGGGCIAIDASNLLDELDTGHDDSVKIIIADTGCGMDDEQVKHLFEPFFTTKTGGTGLGLATVYRIIEAHGGKIEVSSIKGTGTVFTIVLPGGEGGI